MAVTRSRAPVWFRSVAVLLILWGLAGCASFWMHLNFDPNTATPEDRQVFAQLPGWLDAVYAVSVGGGLLGSVALLARSRLAVPFYLASLVAVIVQFGWTFAKTDLLALKGAAATVPFPVFIIALAVFQVWLSTHARRRGWIG